MTYCTLDPPSLDQIGAHQKQQALAVGPYRGLEREQRKLELCKFWIVPLGAQCILTFDIGMHTSGWWKNPDYEAAWHLSLSFFDPETGERTPHNHEIAARIVRGVYQATKNLVWTEGPYSEEGRESATWHYRVFVDLATKLPILPRGEVYSRELTEAGWKSFSEVQEAKGSLA